MKKLTVIIMLALYAVCLSQSFTATDVNTKLPGRSIKESLLYVDCPHVGDSAYTDTGGVDLTTDYDPQELIRGVLLTAGSGNLGIVLAGGGQMVLPVTVTSGTTLEFLREVQINKILADTISTFDGRVFPIY